MLLNSPMKKARIIVLHSHAAPVTRALGRLGVVQITRTEQETGQAVDISQVEEDTDRWRQLSSRVEKLMKRLNLEPPEDLPKSELLDLSLQEAEETVDGIEEAAREPLAEAEAVNEELQRNREQLRSVAPLRGLDIPIERLTESEFVHATTGALPARQVRGMRQKLPEEALLTVLNGDEGGGDGGAMRRVLILVPRKKRFALRTALDEFDFAERDFPADLRGAPAQLYARAQQEQEQLENRRRKAQEDLTEIARTYRDRLIRIYLRTQLELNVRNTESCFGTTRNTVAITGWVPSERVSEVRETVKQATGGQAVIEVRDPTPEEIDEGEVPTCTHHWSALQPFARLVSGYGSADYREIEPTLLFALSFLLMFGFIFGDLGHGLCLLLGGLGAWAWGARRVTMDLGYVIAAAGASSALFGAFFQGTMFGWSLADLGFHWTLAFEPVRLHGPGSGGQSHVIRYLLISIGLGVALISLGMILNVINRLRTGDYAGAACRPFGLVGLLFYWGALAVAARGFLSGFGSLRLWFILLALAAPLLLLLAGSPLQHLLVKGREGLRNTSFTGLVEGLESVMTLFANTLSFLRVAAFALSHAGLSFTIFVLMHLVSGLPAGTFLEVCVFVLGTALVIGLEGLIVAIQIFRLEYYEFFTKFFSAEGREFRPFRLVRGS